MNQIQCVPNWDKDDVCAPVRSVLPSSSSIIPFMPASHQSAFFPTGYNSSTQDNGITELAWENGRLTMHGLGAIPRTSNKNDIASACGTLESIVDQATHKQHPRVGPISPCDHEDLVPLYNPETTNNLSSVPSHMSVATTTDALVPATYMGSCSGVAPSVRDYSDWSVSMSMSTRRNDKWRSVSELGSMSRGASSLDTTTMNVSFDDRDYDSICHSARQREGEDGEDYQKKATSSTKRSRKADIHNQSERKRRDKINQKMKTLQNMVPNSNKTDKASMLDEIIEYVKQLEAKVQMFKTMGSSTMLMPLAQQQRQQLLQMSMMASMTLGYGMGMSIDQLNTPGQSNISEIPNVFLNPSAYMNTNDTTTNGVDRVAPEVPNMALPADPMSMFLANQAHSITMEAYNKIASMCQQFQQQQQSVNQKSDSNK